MSERFSGELVREMPNPVVTRIRYAFSVLTFGLLAVFGFARLPEPVLGVAGGAWFPISFATMAVMRRYAKRPTRTRARVEIDSAGVHVDGTLVARRADLRSGATAARANGATRVVLEQRRTLASYFGVTGFFAKLGIPFPHAMAALVGWSELVCGALLVVGLVSRLATIPLMVTMIVALFTAVSGKIHGITDLLGQVELTYLCMLFAVFILGPGAASIDGLVAGAIDHRGRGRRHDFGAPAYA